MNLTPDEREQYEAWAEQQKVFVVPQIKQSFMSMAMLDRDPGIDILLQLGASIYYGKPLMLVVTPGITIPPRLHAFADEIVYVEAGGPCAEANKTKIEAAMRRMLDRKKEADAARSGT